MLNIQSFIMPYIAGTQYVTGNQPFSPGQPNARWKQSDLGLADDPKPWPSQVPVINLLIGFGGVVQPRAVIPLPDVWQTVPFNYLFLGGVAQKSKG